jgi:hypothetical protein
MQFIVTQRFFAIGPGRIGSFAPWRVLAVATRRVLARRSAGIVALLAWWTIAVAARRTPRPTSRFLPTLAASWPRGAIFPFGGLLTTWGFFTTLSSLPPWWSLAAGRSFPTWRSVFAPLAGLFAWRLRLHWPRLNRL